jgi:hypothetical protein
MNSVGLFRPVRCFLPDRAENCLLADDAALIDDNDYFLRASAQLAELIEIKQGELKKL